MKILSGKDLKESLKEEILKDENTRNLVFYLYSSEENKPSFYYLKGIKKLLDSLSISYSEGFLDKEKTKEENLKQFEEESKGRMVILARPLLVDYENEFISRIPADYDPDMMSFENRGRLYSGDLDYLPATARSVKTILDRYEIDLVGKRCLVIGRSNTVGLPVFELVNRYDGLAVLAHSKVNPAVLNLEAVESDVIFLCSGKPGLIQKEYLRDDQIVIDCGFNPEGGDLGFVPEENELSAYTPVPGGVGALTSYCLILNALTLKKNRK